MNLSYVYLSCMFKMVIRFLTCATGRAQPTIEGQQDAGAEPPKLTSTPSVFVNSEPMREEQVQNAVKFLSHPKVKGSPVMYRRSFLEKKGLTKEEIDEAFRRVPVSELLIAIQANRQSSIFFMFHIVCLHIAGPIFKCAGNYCKSR